MNIELSVIICTHNRYATLEDAIDSVEVQDCSPEVFELIIIDNSTDKYAQKDFASSLDINCNHRYLTEVVPGLSRARNIGVKIARGRIVAFMDDDARASSSWISRIIEDFNDPEIGIAGGPVRPIWPSSRPVWLHPWLEGYLTILDRGDKKRRLNHDEWLAGTNVAFRRELLEKTGMFDESLGRVGALLLSNEEINVSNKIKELGFHSLYDPGVEVYHHVHKERLSPAWIRKRVFWQVISDIFAEGGVASIDFNESVACILSYLASLPPKHRGLSGLFIDIDDPEIFNSQIEAITKFIRLVATDASDWRNFLKPVEN